MSFLGTYVSCLPLKRHEGCIHLALGIFDGVHLGHRKLLHSAIGDTSDLVGVLTFDPHPTRVTRPDTPTTLLFSVQERIAQLKNCGVHFVVKRRFTEHLAQQTPQYFVKMLCANIPSLKKLYVGTNFKFGHDRTGDINTLAACASNYGVEVVAVPRLSHNGTPISSSRIRTCLNNGAIESVNAMLGRPYTCHSRVIRGKGLAKQWRYPTLNLAWQPECHPKFGVYAVTLRYRNKFYNGVANYGVRPTVGAHNEALLEIHILNGEIMVPYGRTLEVHWHHYLREEQTFSSVENLRHQIADDVDRVTKILKADT